MMTTLDEPACRGRGCIMHTGIPSGGWQRASALLVPGRTHVRERPMSSRTKLYCADTGIPDDSEPTAEEEALARTMPFHGHECDGATSIVQHSRDRGGGWQQHSVGQLIDQIAAGDALLADADGADSK